MLEAMAATDSAPAPVSERLTLDEVGKRRIRELVRRGRKQDTTLANYESEIRCHFVPHFAEKPIAEIGEDDVADFLDACLNERSIKTVRNLYVHLNAIFEFATRKRWCHANPCKLVDKPASAAEDDTEIRFLDRAELDALLAVPAATASARSSAPPERECSATRSGCNGRTSARRSTAPPRRRCTCTGQRPTSLATRTCGGSTWRCISRRRCRGSGRASCWRSGGEMSTGRQGRSGSAVGCGNGKRRTPKSATSARAVPMADRVGGALDRLFQASAYQAGDDLVFGHPHTGRPLDRSQVSKRFKRSLQRAGVREVRFHDLRHTFGTRMAAAGVPIRTLQAWMGHSDIKTTMVYTHYAPAPNEVDLVNDAFDPQVALEGANEGAKPSETQPHSDP
jgi:integrase